jgi:hypothetical protein
MIIKEDYCGTKTNPMLKYEMEIEIYDNAINKNVGYLLLKNFINSTLINGVNSVPYGTIDINIEIGKGMFDNIEKAEWINQEDGWYINIYNKPLCFNTINQYTASTCAAIVTNCIDFRFIDDTIDKMNCAGLNNNYDNIVLPGVTVFMNYEGSDSTLLVYKDIYTKYFENSVILADQLHAVKALVIVEHEDCGAYKAVYGDQEYYNNMIELHKENIQKFVRDNKEKYSYYFYKFFGYIVTTTGDLIAVNVE